MADTKTSALSTVTPVLTDTVRGVDDPGGTPVAVTFTLQEVMELFEANLYGSEDLGVGTSMPNKSGVGRAITVNGTSNCALEFAIGDSIKAFFLTDGTTYGQMVNTGSFPFFLGAGNTTLFQVDSSGNAGVNLGYGNTLTSPLGS